MQEKDFGELLLINNNKKIYSKNGVISKVYDHNFYSGSDVLREL